MSDNRFIHVLNEARQKNIAVGAVNIFNYLTADAAAEAARQLNVNLIIQTSAGTVEHFGAKRLYDMVDSLRKDLPIEVALHLDHCRNKELGMLCVDTGWDAIMMDFSHLPFEENIKNTRELAEYAHERNVAIEGEIGIISGVEEDIVSDTAVGADYEETMEFIQRSRIDAIAPAIGTAHGIYHGVPKINFELVERLGKETTPVVIHGGSGLSADTFIRLIAAGGRKVNISTLVKNAYLDKIRELVLSDKKYAPIPFDTEVKQAVVQEVQKHLKVFSGLSKEF
ncbi:ketose-bisphosphate aldolase [Eubacterium sp. 14-2]|uniref:class II fructose-bisphosphate aldolase n=1 Tax=Eubacterium sp. 14-2 TaxID=1235790 RepID=UPI00033DAB1A|nr:class II fructose-bisphosphate aldolase [Eubacterium sp. 14-2]EOT28754.1 ketose-bisphosphate aldolase [Eubacterium sp. 14-2]